MKKKIIGILVLLLSLIGGGTYTFDRLGWVPQGGDPQSSGSTFTTTSVSHYKKSIYHPTSTDEITSGGDPWIMSTSSYLGTPTLVLGTNPDRMHFECENRSMTTTTLWLSNTTSTAMTTSTNSDGYQLTYLQKLNTKTLGIIWPGKVYGLADTTTSTLRCTFFK